MAELRKFQTDHKQAIFKSTFSDANNFLFFLFFSFHFLYFLGAISYTIRLTFFYNGDSNEHNRLSKHTDLCDATCHAVILFFT